MNTLPLLPGFTGAAYWHAARLHLMATLGPWHAFWTLRRAAVALRDQGATPRARLAASAAREALKAARNS